MISKKMIDSLHCAIIGFSMTLVVCGLLLGRTETCILGMTGMIYSRLYFVEKKVGLREN